ncbi:hypothetical protein ES703_115565 [subsurface metagenome]
MPTDDPVEIKKADIVILSQACDILNEKIDSIVVCPVWPLKHLVSADPYYRSSKARENLRQGKEPAYHLLNSYQSPSFNFILYRNHLYERLLQCNLRV